MIVLWGDPSGDVTWDLTYVFKSESAVSGTGLTDAFATYHFPTHNLSHSLGVTGSNAFSYFLNILNAGATIALSPMWCFRTSLAAGVSVGATSFTVTSTNDLYENEYVMLFRVYDPSLSEARLITDITDSTITVDSSFANEHVPITMPTASTSFDTRSSIVLPCITGILEYEGLEFLDGLPSLGAKIKIDGGVWNSVTIPESIPSFTSKPYQSSYTTPEMERIVYGQENGILQLTPYGTSSRIKLECTWNFVNEEWKDLRNLFFAARGGAEEFYLPSGLYEMTIKQGSDSGSTSIYLDSGYADIFSRFPQICIFPRLTQTAPFFVTVTGHVSYEQFTCSALSNETNIGDRVCIAPLVRFATDELTFSFKNTRACEVKASFLEAFI